MHFGIARSSANKICWNGDPYAMKWLLVFTALITGCAHASFTDRCAFKTGDECLDDPKCLWESHDGDDGFSSVMYPVFDEIKSTVCPTVADAVVAAREDGNLESFLTSDELCVSFCGSYTKSECEAFLSTGGASEITDTLLLRKLQDVFQSDFMSRRMHCELCLDCYKDSAETVGEIRVFANLEADEIVAICEAKFHHNDGDCTSRCDPEQTHPRDCYKEGDRCRCKLNKAGGLVSALADLTDDEVENEMAYEGMRDILCPHVDSVTDFDIEETCRKLEAAAEDTSESGDICRGVCPLSGRCSEGFNELPELQSMVMSDGRIAAGMTTFGLAVTAVGSPADWPGAAESSDAPYSDPPSYSPMGSPNWPSDTPASAPAYGPSDAPGSAPSTGPSAASGNAPSAGPSDAPAPARRRQLLSSPAPAPSPVSAAAAAASSSAPGSVAGAPSPSEMYAGGPYAAYSEGSPAYAPMWNSPSMAYAPHDADWSTMAPAPTMSAAQLRILVESASEDLSVGAMNCALCEHCKLDSDVYANLADFDTCTSYLADVVDSCSTDPVFSGTFSPNVCHRECVPTNEARECRSIDSKKDCHEAAACRWVKKERDPLEEYLFSAMENKFHHGICHDMSRMFQALPSTASDDKLVSRCRAALGCTDDASSACELFMGPDDGRSGSRRLLSFSDDAGFKFDSGSPDWAGMGRKLMSSSTEDWFAQTTMAEMVDTIMNCTLCHSTCEDVGMLREMSEISFDDDMVETIKHECQQADFSSPPAESHCDAVCSTIPPGNCGLYGKYCSCDYEEMFEYDEHETWTGVGDSGGYCFPMHHGSGSCAFDAGSNSCSDGCVMHHGDDRYIRELSSRYAPQIRNGTERIMQTVQRMEGVDLSSITVETVCQLAGFCYHDVRCHGPYCSDCDWCARIPAASELRDYLTNTTTADLEARGVEEAMTKLVEIMMGFELCYPDCDQRSFSMDACHSNPACGWRSYDDDSGFDDHYQHYDHYHHFDEGFEEECSCHTRMDDRFSCSFSMPGTCSEGCVLDVDLFAKTSASAMFLADEVFRFGNASFFNASMPLTTWNLCETMEACNCHNAESYGQCEPCRHCAESGLARRILDMVASVDYRTPESFQAETADKPEMQTMIIEFTRQFFGVEICYAPSCRDFYDSPNKCRDDRSCTWQCHGPDETTDEVYERIDIEFEEAECFCEAIDELRDSCVYNFENERCSRGCDVRGDVSWSDVYTEHFQQNLIYVSMLLSRFKLEAGHQRVGWVETLTGYDVCSWIEECPSDGRCFAYTGGDMYDDSIPYECSQCMGCTHADPVMEILDLFQNSGEDRWNDGLNYIADKYAKAEASHQICRPTVCDKYEGTHESCLSDERCRLNCYQGHDDYGHYDDHDDDDDREGEGENDGCMEFMLNWKENMENPRPFCNDQRDVSLDECMDTMHFLRDISAAGHLATLETRAKLCNIFSQLPTVDIIKKRLGFLFCDPSQQCCGQSDAFEDTGVTLTESRCLAEEGCTFRSECVPMVDRCYETLLSASANSAGELPECDHGCAFIESSNLNSFDTAHGRGFCVDLLAEERCRISAMFGCTEGDCMTKPICEPPAGQNFGCLGGDACCIPTVDGVISSDECSSDGCQLNKKCIPHIDDCAYFGNERDCNFQRACQFVPVKNPYDRAAGKCISKKNRCEPLSNDECRDSSDCRLIDSCETRVCEVDDACCGLLPGECRADDACAYRGNCKMKKEYNICAYFQSKSDCSANHGLCAWDKESRECQSSYDHCAAIPDRMGCAFDDSCVYEEACVNACDACEDCIAEFEALAMSDDTRSVSEMQSDFLALCAENQEYDVFHCFETSIQIAKSKGTWINRPGAICASLRACRESCSEPGTDAALSRCSETGWDDSSDADVSDTDVCATCDRETEFCEKAADSPVVCSCDPLTGFDTCKREGVCVDKCERFQARLDAYNSYITACSDDSDCDDNFSCDTNTPARQMTCSNGVVSISTSDGSCLPVSRTMTSAQFDDYGRTIEVEFNFPARTTQFAASAIFNGATMNLLGNAFCVVHGLTMTIYLRQGARIEPGDALVLKASQKLLKDALNDVAFVNSDTDILVTACTSCVSPTVYVSYPDRLSAGCSALTAPRAAFDGSLTVDYTGRELDCVWTTGVGSDSDECYRETTSSSRGPCDTLSTQLTDATGPVLDFTSDFVRTLSAEPGWYTIRLTCTNFLGESDYEEIEFEVVGDPMPLISVPQAVYFQKSLGVVVPAFISQESICPGDTVLYSWTSTDLDIPNGEYTNKDFRMASYVGAFSESVYTLILEASLLTISGDLRTETGTAEVKIYPISSPVVSKLWGASGDVVISDDIVLTPYCYDPDDPANVESAFAYDYACIRGFDEELVLDDSSTRPCEILGDIDDSSITLRADDLVVDVWYIYTFTCLKDSREHSSTIAFRPRSAESPIPTGQVVRLCRGDCPESHDPNQPLALMVQDLTYADAEIQWSCSVDLGAEDVLLGDFESQIFVILGEVLPEVESIECIATLERDGEVGESRIEIKINTKPFCSSESESCVAVETVSDSDAFPLATFKLSALGFSDDQDTALEYAFGCFDEANVREIFFKGSQSSYEIGGLSVGDHICFVCAIDAYGSETCETVTVTVTELDGGVTDEVLDQVIDAVDTAVASQDVHAVLQSVKTAAELADVTIVSTDAPAPAPEADTSDARRRLLSESSSVDTDSLVTSVITVLGDFDPFVSEEFLRSVAELADLAPDVNTTSLSSLSTTVQSGLEASALASTVYTAEETTQLVQDVAEIMAVILDTTWSDDDALTIRQTYNSLLSYSQDLLCVNVFLGQSETVSATLSNGDAVHVSCLRQQPSDLVNTDYAVGDVAVTFPSAFETSCEDTCPSELEIQISVSDNSDLPFSLVTSFPVAGASDMATLSGVVKLEAADLEAGDVFCSDSGCAAVVTIPVSSYNSTKTTACFLINGAEAEGGSAAGIAFVANSYSDSDATVQCEISTFGEIIVMEYTALNVEELASEIELPDDTGLTTPVEPGNDDSEVIEVNLRFADMVYDDLVNDELEATDFKINVAYQLAQTSPITDATYEVIELLAGSVIAVVEVTLPSDTSQSDVDAFVDTYESDPASLFDSAFLTTYGTPTVEVTSAPGMTPESDDSDDTNIVAIVVPIVVGAVVIGALIGFFFFRCTAQTRSLRGARFLHDDDL